MNLPKIAVILVATLAIAGLTNAAPAAGNRDDSFEKIDLTSINAGVYYVMCQNFEDRPSTVLDCRIPTVWEETNPVKGLQSTKYGIGGKAFDADTPLLA